jgi:hypothetical protein
MPKLFRSQFGVGLRKIGGQQQSNAGKKLCVACIFYGLVGK